MNAFHDENNIIPFDKVIRVSLPGAYKNACHVFTNEFEGERTAFNDPDQLKNYKQWLKDEAKIRKMKAKLVAMGANPPNILY